ncbi:hypothetical protein BD560DRAFT_409507 [Blakeslea trispora]|nr:hypothetical protein BD560DRAFT_409507 [Blakeslea trispora]
MKQILVLLLLSLLAVDAVDPGLIPIPGKPVYIKKSNTLWVFSFSKNTQAGNKLSFIDLNQSFDTLQPPVTDKSSLITNNQCPVMHFAQALPSADGVSINIFGAGSDLNGSYESSMTVCQFNTETKAWKQLQNTGSLPLARRNAALEFTSSNLTWFFGGSSDPFTGLSSSTQISNYWHQDTSIYDSSSHLWISGPQYDGHPRSNATMTQISDTNGQLMIVGGSVINNISAADMVTNHPLANMSDIIVLDPRTSIWSNLKTYGDNSPIGRKHHTTTLHPDGRTLVVIGGESFNETGAFLLNDVWLLDTRNMNNLTWTQPEIHGLGYFRSNHTSILIGDQIWVIAGTNESSKAVDIQLLNLTSWTWSQSAIYKQASSVPFSQLGGLKGFIGLIVGIAIALALILGSLVFYWRRRRRITSFSKNRKGGSSLDSANYEYEIAQNMSPAIDEHSKIYVPRPSISNIASRTSTEYNPNVHTLTSQASSGGLQINTNSSFINQYNHIDQAHVSSASPSYQERYFDENYHTSENDNMYNVDQSNNRLYGYGNLGVGVTQPSRHSLGYWESPTAVPTHQANTLINNAYPPTANYFLMPSTNRIDERVYPKNQNIAYHLQKPNEVDHLEGETTINTVCSSTTDEDASSSATPIASVDPLHKSMPTVTEEKG